MLLVAGAALLAPTGCRPTPAYQGRDGEVLATYRIRRLTADLPPEVRVPAVVAAARATLLERGYAIQAMSATEDQGSVSAAPPDAGLFETVEVVVSQTGAGTHLRIISQPAGDQVRSRAVLDGILAKLGR